MANQGIFCDRSQALPLETKALLAGLVLANILGWAWAYALFSNSPSLLGIALLAWVFGLRHAVDADHIAAIDNVVRKLMSEGKRPMSVGFYFSLGHSTVVIAATIVIALAAGFMQGNLESIKTIGSTIGTSVSAAFLLVIAFANILILRGVWKSFKHVSRGGTLQPENMDMLLAGGGILARIFRPIIGAVKRSWHMYPLGFLFGLGFDTASEIGLLGISATQSAQGMSPWMVLVFPVLFTAAMALVDTIDSVLMVGAYGWAFVHPIRKLWYNLTITAASVVVAVLIGGVEALALIANRFDLEGRFWGAISAFNDDLAQFGFVVVGVFILAWAVSVLIYRWKGYDQMALPAAE
ncbi:MAG: HoxN/HupN/NixA family nickel/cobalt transporter [Hyphomicrobiales bacterium]|nr:HoxN/HupN/NixA family nickel/cobalt transporter [Hyphomicrobiales bacterium]